MTYPHLQAIDHPISRRKEEGSIQKARIAGSTYSLSEISEVLAFLHLYIFDSRERNKSFTVRRIAYLIKENLSIIIGVDDLIKVLIDCKYYNASTDGRFTLIYGKME